MVFLTVFIYHGADQRDQRFVLNAIRSVYYGVIFRFLCYISPILRTMRTVVDRRSKYRSYRSCRFCFAPFVGRDYERSRVFGTFNRCEISHGSKILSLYFCFFPSSEYFTFPSLKRERDYANVYHNCANFFGDKSWKDVLTPRPDSRM